MILKVPIHSMNEFREVFETGVERRKVGPTGLNDVSSRSHAVLAIAVTNGVSKGKLNLIDLAGSLLLQTPIFFFLTFHCYCKMPIASQMHVSHR